MSRKMFVKEIFKLAELGCKVNAINVKKYSMPVRRPKNIMMSTDKVAKIFNVEISNWKKSLQACIKNIEDKQ